MVQFVYKSTHHNSLLYYVTDTLLLLRLITFKKKNHYIDTKLLIIYGNLISKYHTNYD